MNFSSYEKRYGVTLAQFTEIANSAPTAIDASVELGMPYKTYARVARKLGVFKINMGRKGEPIYHETRSTPLEEILLGLHPNYGGNKVKHRLVEAGLKEWKCEWCEITEWRGEPIALELDHINGNNSDHRLENLRILCPNCHSQTSTYGSKNKEKIERTSIPKRTVKEYQEDVKKKNDEKYSNVIEEVKNAGINFRKFGWVKAVSLIVDIEPQKVGQWMKRNMPDVYKSCYRR